MTMVMAATTTCLIMALLSFSPCIQSYKFVDLSHTQTESTIYWPTVPRFNWTSVAAGTNTEGVWIESGAYTSGEHGGTHIDVPKHFVKGGLDLSRMPLDRTVAEGVLVDCSAEAAENKDYGVTVEKIKKWEEKHGRIPNEAAVLFYFGYAPKFSDPVAYFNTPEYDNFKKFVFPYVTKEAAKWLLDHRNLKMIGVDVASPDKPRDLSYPVHVTLLSKNVILLENVNIPTSLPARDFRLHAAPIKIAGGTGVQTRIYAMLYDRMTGGTKQISSRGPLGLFVCLASAFTLVRVFLIGGSC